MTQSPIELRGIVKSYGRKQVLTGLDLAVPKGSVVGLLGTNGSGKTTLIKCALGLIRPQAGVARLLDEDSWTLSGEAKARIGYVPQVVNLYPWMKVRHLIDYTAAFYPNWNQSLVSRLMEQWAIPPEDRVGPLSVGQLQKVAIMLALGHEPELLLLDEPAASLDPLARREFLQMIIDLARAGRAHGAFLDAHHLGPGARGGPGGHFEVRPYRLVRAFGRPEGANARQPGRQFLGNAA